MQKYTAKRRLCHTSVTLPGGEAPAHSGRGVVLSRSLATVPVGEQVVLEEGCPLVRRIRKK